MPPGDAGPLNLLLDTHALLWWLGGGVGLSEVQENAIRAEEAQGRPLAVASISLWEIAKLVERGRISIHGSLDVLFETLETLPTLRFLPLTPRIALESTRLPAPFPRDPADQLIAATARVHGLRLVTADERIRETGVVAVV
jgi:PIN domain nuclease of toxin-antitoxin system